MTVLSRLHCALPPSRPEPHGARHASVLARSVPEGPPRPHQQDERWRWHLCGWAARHVGPVLHGVQCVPQHSPRTLPHRLAFAWHSRGIRVAFALPDFTTCSLYTAGDDTRVGRQCRPETDHFVQPLAAQPALPRCLSRRPRHARHADAECALSHSLVAASPARASRRH